MTQEEKSILLLDLCARVPYGVKVQYKGNRYDLTEMHKDGRTYLGSYNSIYGDWNCSLKFEDYPKPYLRPMSSMTEEEDKEVSILLNYEFYIDDDYALAAEDDRHRISLDLIQVYIDWLNRKMFDYRGLIEKGLALEAPEEMYK